LTERRPLRVRAAVAALALLVGLVAVLGTWQVLSARSTQQNDILAGEATAAHLAGSALAGSLDGRLQQLDNLASQPQVPALFTSRNSVQLEQLTAALHLLYPDFASFVIVSGAGRVLSRWPADPSVIGRDESSQPFYTGVERTKGPYVAPGTQQSAPPHDFVVVLAVPVEGSAHNVVGMLVATLPASSLGTVIGSSLEPDGQLLVIDQLGHLVTGPSASATHSYSSMGFVADALAGKSGSGTGDVPGFSDSRLVGYAPVPGTGWAVIAERPLSDLTGPITGLTERLLGIGLIVLLLAIGTALYIGSLVRRLAREHEHAGAVLTSVGDGVATLDISGTVRQVNPALARLVGRPAAEVGGRPSNDAMPLYDQFGRPVSWDDAVVAEAVRERRAVPSVGYTLYLGTSDGSRVPIAVTAAPLLAGTTLEGAVVVVRDVSHEREVDQLKSSLVSTVSHELRTPLTMIQGFSELLLTRDDLDPQRSRESLTQIHVSAQRLGRLIDELLSVSRIESGKLTVDLAPLSLREVTDDVLAAFSRDGDRRLTVQVDPALGHVLADRDKTTQIVTNLVSNAVKYSPAGSEVQIEARQVGDHAEVAVTDHGIGMTDEECAQIFEKFVRADHPLVRKVGGTGLGLYITRSLVELQQGQLWVKSSPGSGSTFTFSLPLAVTPPAAEHEPESVPQSAGRKA
jgi:PAS domain S-box-containing protein